MKYLAAFLAVVVGALAFASASPTFSVIPLPYAQDALEPAISNRTVSFHYGKHVATYVATSPGRSPRASRRRSTRGAPRRSPPGSARGTGCG
jgi:hypothetical protein